MNRINRLSKKNSEIKLPNGENSSSVHIQHNNLANLVSAFNLKVSDNDLFNIENEQMTIVVNESRSDGSGTGTKTVTHTITIDPHSNFVVYESSEGGLGPRNISFDEVLTIGHQIKSRSRVESHSINSGKDVSFAPYSETLKRSVSFDIETYWQLLESTADTYEALLFGDVDNPKGLHAQRIAEDPKYKELYEKHVERKQTDPNYKKKMESKTSPIFKDTLAGIETQVALVDPKTGFARTSNNLGDSVSTIEARNPSTAAGAFAAERTKMDGETLRKFVIEKMVGVKDPDLIETELVKQTIEGKKKSYDDLMDTTTKYKAKLSAYNGNAFDVPRAKETLEQYHASRGELTNAKKDEIAKKTTERATDSMAIRNAINNNFTTMGKTDFQTENKMNQYAKDLIEVVNDQVDAYVASPEAREMAVRKLASEQAARDISPDVKDFVIDGDTISYIENGVSKTVDVDSYIPGITDDQINERLDEIRSKKLDITNADSTYSSTGMSHKSFFEDYIGKRINANVLGDARNMGTLTELALSLWKDGVLDDKTVETFKTQGVHIALQDAKVEADVLRGLRRATAQAVPGSDGTPRVRYRNPRTTLEGKVFSNVMASIIDKGDLPTEVIGRVFDATKGMHVVETPPPTITNSAIGSTVSAIAGFAFSSFGAYVAENTYHYTKNRMTTQDDAMTMNMVQRLYGKDEDENERKIEMERGLLGHVTILPALAFLAVSKMSDKKLDSTMGSIIDKASQYFSKDGHKAISKDISNAVDSSVQSMLKNISTSFKYSNTQVDNKMMGLGFLAASGMIMLAGIGRKKGKDEYDSKQGERVNNALEQLNIPIGDEEDSDYIDAEDTKPSIFNNEAFNPLKKNISDVYEYNNSYLDQKGQYDLISKVEINQPTVQPKRMVDEKQYGQTDLKERFNDIRRTSERANINNNRMV